MIEEMQGFRLSPQQKHLWHLQESDNFPYCSQCAVLIEGNLEIDTLKIALEQVVNRHEILRTNFHCLPGMTIPLQVIGNNDIIWNENHNLSSCTPQEQEEFLSALFDQVHKQTFNLVEGSPLHLSLVTLSPSKYVLLISLPALCADAATLKILVQEISQSYAACLQGKELDDEPLQYADLAEWQNELLEGADTEVGRDYWRKQDFSTLIKLNLPFEKQSLEQLEFQPHTQSFTISPALLEQIDTLTQQYNISVAEFFLASWQILLARLTKQQNLSIGVAYEGRKYQELEKSLGLFTKYLPLILNIEFESSFIDILHKNHACAEQLYKLQDYFTWESLAQSYPNTLGFFPFSFDFEELPGNHLAADVSFSIDRLSTCIERFKVKLSCTRQNNTLNIAFHYDSNLFDVEDIKRLVGQFQTLLASASAYPDLPISQLEVLSDNERQLLDEVNNTKRDYPHNKCIHQLFEEQARKTPNKVAVIFEDQQLTYHQLNQRANKIAHYLQKQGVGSEVLVGLCVERSLDMIVGLLAILKAGGAYVPLDPALPKEGLALRLQDARVSLVISHSSLVNNFEQITVIYLDSDSEIIAQENEVNLNTKVTSGNLVYALFTSGSTGRPKGVAIEHRQLLNYLYAIIDTLNLPAGANFGLVSTFAADLGNTVIFPCLCTGGCLHVISYERATDPAALAEYCHRHPIDCLKIVPSHLASLLTSSSPKSILPRKRLILGGEATSWELIEQIQRYAQDCQIFNHYGPTEATVGVLTYLVELNDDLSCNQKSKTVPLGRSIRNTQVYVLEENLQPAPIGVSGEIYIGGTTLARCYLNQPEQTAVKFIPNPFSQEEGARFYKTGDRARYLPDGTIEFLGRIDHQVKIRGFRVELGEIEAVLSLHPNVREVVVLARDSESGQNYLAAYVVPSQESPILINELRNYMQARLPEYMVPSTFVMLKALPLTPNGKVDRQALPEPNQVRSELETSFTNPRTPVEEVLAGIWARVLGTEHVGIHDNFFDLGGHSLLATQVVSQIREAFQVELRLRSLFETPTLAGLAEVIETAVRAGQKLELPPIEHVSREGELPLSFPQQRLWFLDQLEPGNPFYNISRGVILKGSLNVTALEQSLNEIVRRHEVLRTNFRDVDGRPVQEIASVLNITLPIIDLGELSEEERVASVRQLARSHAQQPFDLTEGSLLRTTLLRLKEEEHVLVFTIHHIVADGWSAGVIVREVAALYESFCSGKPSSLPELTIQYADFAIWQRQWLQTEVQSSQMAYWKQQLGGHLPVLQLPTDRSRPAIQTFRGRKQPWQISKTLTEALKSLSKGEAVTLFMTMLAAFKVLLYRYTNQADILIGSPIANRNRKEIEGLIGFFVNTLVLRTDLSGNPSFKELLRRIREVTLDAYAYQDLPFEQLVEQLQPERNLSYTPLFQVMFVLQNAPMEELTLPDLSLSPMEVEPETAMFDVTVFLTETEQGLMGVFEYNSDLFDAATIERIQGNFQTLLEGIVANPEQHLSDLPILSATQQQQLLVDWNQTSADYPSICIHQLFEAQVEQTPGAVAVVFEDALRAASRRVDQQLTYQELNVRANQLAHYLQTLGVGPEVLVGICVERSLDMLIGLLGILKAGGAYVPLDPAYPRDRLAFMLEDAKVSVLLTQKKLVAALPEHKAKVVCLDTDWQEIDEQSNCHSINQATTKDLAYVIYTSGSTGKPKGVQISHGALVNFLSAMRQNLKLTKEDILLSVTTLSFDIAALELYLPLIVGARLVLVSREIAVDGTQLLEGLTLLNTTIMQATPATWRLLLSAGWQDNRQLKILCGGEALDSSLANQLLERGTQVWNLYGPTETTIWSSVRIIESNPDQKERGEVISIGRPIANTQFYILDSHQQLVPVGVPGELHIGGVGLARGYLNQPELTAQKFIPNPFENSKWNRLYKTGDLARYLPNGEIEYLGRIDNQVKLRGFRIELGEIEALLSQHPMVRESIVVAFEDELASKRLVAYVVLHLEQTVTVTELRHFLESKLPSYMVPSAFVILEALPLTPNGKVDRRALRALDTTKFYLKEAFVAPRNPVEEVVAGIWIQVLGIEQLGIDDNFFELGGHSLLATQVISRIWKTFEVQLSLRRLFESPTVAGLAKAIQQTIEVKVGQQTPPLLPVSRDENIPLSFAQERLWLLEQLQPGSATYNIPVAVQFVGLLNVNALEESLCEIVQRHEVLRTTFPVLDGQPFQAIASTITLKLPIVDLRELPQAEQKPLVQRLIDEESQRTFDLAQGPLLRCTIVRVSDQEHIVLFTIHHIVSDGWTMGVFIRELAALYQAFCAGKPSPLPELPIQYADFAVWQRQQLQGETLEAQLAYWKQQLGNNQTVLQLPTTRPRTEVKTNKGATQSFLIPSNRSQELQALSRQEGVTLFMTLLAGFQILLQRYTSQDDIVVGTDVANRNRAEIELLIGFFVNLLVLRTDLSGNPTFGELLKRVRSITLGAYAHQDLPFEKLVEALQPERNLSNTPPLFQVLFVLQNAPIPPLELPGLTLSQLEVENKVARFDLALFLTETEQGILGKWQYNADLFDTLTITRMAGHFQTLLNSIISQPDARLSNLEMLTEEERKQQVMQKKERKAFKREKFISIAPKAVSLSQEKWVVTDYLQPGQTFPLVIQPAARDIDLVAWAKTNQEFIETELLKHGAILFRGFNVDSVSEFESVAQAICPDLFGEYGDLPRAGESGKVYGSTPYPPDKAILFHNESSHLHQWPLKIWFFCVQPAQKGGDTPIVDCRKAYQLLTPKLRERLAQKQFMYVRNYTNGLDVSWQDFFRTNDKFEVENYCRKTNIDFEWYDNNGLITRQVRPALAVHPKTGDPVFFNQIQLHHIAYLDAEVRESLLSTFGDKKLPRNVYYGDGTPIEDEVITEINEVYQQSQISFPWQQGDILMLDNMLTAHGRNSYSGYRKIVVAMGEMIKEAQSVSSEKEKMSK
ncbi:non-ribosomal peptide synthetase [Brasilonema octagenarum UFV-E1]|uniref:Non-ribosomal peptide synthetase n=1 Tax=Brasilonema sennae CENA114 TaxID=415709 RepID=A0A856MKZ3_9CYAN|nr:non-ribosomal peptide synthetase [Brasilonema sennae]QDL10800.1 non-ribosomal peptide synthetase [Brasilonema sennae CENA114]QDL17146.1 non-ribosomal peptide synthetase [Brasilonema octagenarum UFV-E1]